MAGLLSFLAGGARAGLAADTGTMQGVQVKRDREQKDLLSQLARDRQAQQDAQESERMGLLNALTQAQTNRANAPVVPDAPRKQYDSARGGWVGEDGSFTPVQGLPPIAAKPQDAYEERTEGGGTAIYEGGRFTKWKIPPPETAPTRAQLPTQGERKAEGLYRTGKLGYDTLEKLLTVQDDPTTPEVESGNRAAPRFRDKVMSKTPWGVGNFLSSDELRQQEQAAYDLQEAWLRLTSGAVISPEEIRNSAKALIPQPGDDPVTLAQKRAARQARIEAVKSAAGRALDPNAQGQQPDIDDDETVTTTSGRSFRVVRP